MRSGVIPWRCFKPWAPKAPKPIAVAAELCLSIGYIQHRLSRTYKSACFPQKSRTRASSCAGKKRRWGHECIGMRSSCWALVSSITDILHSHTSLASSNLHFKKMGKSQKKTGKGRLDKYYKLAKCVYPLYYSIIVFTTHYLGSKAIELVQLSSWFSWTRSILF